VCALFDSHQSATLAGYLHYPPVPLGQQKTLRSYPAMSIQKKSLISTLKTTKKANIASGETVNAGTKTSSAKAPAQALRAKAPAQAVRAKAPMQAVRAKAPVQAVRAKAPIA
jgi:hypothetical protein